MNEAASMKSVNRIPNGRLLFMGLFGLVAIAGGSMGWVGGILSPIGCRGHDDVMLLQRTERQPHSTLGEEARRPRAITEQCTTLKRTF